MYKSAIAFAALALAVVASPETQNFGPLQFTQRSMYIEYSATFNEAEIVVEGEAEEALERVDVTYPSGAPLARLQTRGTPGSCLAGFRLETGETDLASLWAQCPTGAYRLRGRAVSGRPVVGDAALSHECMTAPVITYPIAGSSNVVANNLVLHWNADPQVAHYRIDLEQNENDGLNAMLSAGTTSFQIPAGVLAPQTETRLELQAIGPSGNRTTVEIHFTTL
jgi:hypothetical protein